MVCVCGSEGLRTADVDAQRENVGIKPWRVGLIDILCRGVGGTLEVLVTRDRFLSLIHHDVSFLTTNTLYYLTI